MVSDGTKGPRTSSKEDEDVPPLTMRRLMQEFKIHQSLYEEHREKGTLNQVQYRLVPDPQCILRWHFLIFNLPSDSPFWQGVYRGIIKFPKDYPWSPPSIAVTTPNGRFRTNMKICLNMTNYHPSQWNPLWRADTIVMGLISFMLCSDEEAGGFVGHVVSSDEVRKTLAGKSMEYNLQTERFAELFPDFVDTKSTLQSLHQE